MELLQLQYFKIVAETHNITKAAEQLFISQPSLSQTIHRLEKELGYSLFHRTGRHIELNENGAIFLNCVQKIEIAIKNAKTEIAERNENLQKQISLYIGCASHLLPELLTYLKKNLANVTFLIHQQSHSSSSSGIDLQIIATQNPISDSNYMLLLKENILLALPKNHPLIKKKTITTDDLSEEHFISLSPAWTLSNYIANSCAKADFQPDITIQLDNPSLMRNFLRDGLGIAFIPEITWGTAFANNDLVLRRVKNISIERYVYLKWNCDTYLSKNILNCIQLIQEFFSQYTSSVRK